jgi:hypothetical protein
MRLILLLASFAFFSVSAYANKAHVHGEGKLNVAIDKDTVTIDLELPLDVVVGFERAPKNDKEKAALTNAEQILGDAALFTLSPAAKCTAQPVKLNMPGFQAKDGDHADIDARYTFRCAVPAELKSIETGVFKQLKRLYRLEAQRVGPSGQGAMRLSPKQPILVW